MLSKEAALEKLSRQKGQIAELLNGPRFPPAFRKWQRDTEVAITNIFGEQTRHLDDFRKVHYSLSAFSSSTPDYEFHRAYQRGLQNAPALLQSLIDEIEEYWTQGAAVDERSPPLTRLERLADRFHLVARRLRKRHEARPTLQIEDEYDVQDLLAALLQVDFEDVRPEEWSPSRGGKSSRLDFLLKREGIVVEVKKTRKGLAEKELGDQLFADIGRYQVHPDCRMLFCFVYDPEGRIGNPSGFESDLSGKHGDLDVRVVIAPKGL